MATPVYRIYYGKYPDQLTNEIENTHIMEVDGLRFRMEPGKPGEPTVDEVSFTLKNLDHTASEIYPRSWFENAARSAAEGAIVPLQLFFRIEMPDFGNRGFTGVLRNKKYAKYRESVTVTIKDPTDLIKESDVFMLKPFTFENTRLQTQNTIPGYDLNGDSIETEPLSIRIDGQKSENYDDLIIDHPYAAHRNYQALYEADKDNINFPGSGPVDVYVIAGSEVKRSTFIKVGENTLLTTVEEQLIVLKDFGSPDEYWLRMVLIFYHAHNGNVTVPEYGEVLERGRYFKDDEGTHISTGDEMSVTIYDYNMGFDDDILVDESHLPTTKFFYHGCEVAEDTPSAGEYTIHETGVSWFDTLAKAVEVFEEGLYTVYYDTPSNVDLFDRSRVPAYINKHAFWADLMMYGWLDTEPTEILINMAMQLNCYLYYNEDGKIAFHPRDYHEQYLPSTLPPGAFEVQLGDIEPLGDYEEDHGFDSFKIEVTDRIEINNVESDEPRTVHVDTDGQRQDAALRSNELTIENYRTGDLGVPNIGSPADLPVFRYSPDDPSFTGSVNVDGLEDFLPTAVQQAQRFAASWSYPEVLWKIQWDMPKYPQAGIGQYFWVAWPTKNRVYLIRDITHDPDGLLHKMEVQEVGTYNG